MLRGRHTEGGFTLFVKRISSITTNPSLMSSIFYVLLSTAVAQRP